MPCCVWSQQLSSNWCELQNGYCFTSTFPIPIQISFLVHPTGKQAGKRILGSVVRPGQDDTSPSQHTQLSTKLSLLEGLIRRAFIRNSHLPSEQVHWFGTKLGDHTQRREVTASSGCGCMSYDLHRQKAKISALELCANRVAEKVLIQENLQQVLKAQGLRTDVSISTFTLRRLRATLAVMTQFLFLSFNVKCVYLLRILVGIGSVYSIKSQTRRYRYCSRWHNRKCWVYLLL